jgi:hypothetical protein
MSVKVTMNRLPTIAKRLPEAADVLVQRHGAAMEGIAKSHARVDTGEMREGIHWTKTGQATGELTGSTDHDLFNEFGTVNLPSQAMFRPAADEEFPKLLDDLGHLEGMLQ